VEHLISSTETKGCDAFDSISVPVTQVEDDGSDGGVEGPQDDNEDVEGEYTDCSNVSVGDGDVVSGDVGN
jgi:hypothetical protein